MIDPSWIVGLGVILFGIGLLGTFYHKNAIVVLMCIELMLNSDNQTINFSSSFTDIPIINATQYNSSTGLGSSITSITDITKSSFRVFSSSGTTKIYYSAVGK